MIERGVRFIQIMHPTWDDHSDLNKKLKKNCDITDRPTAALLKDLKQRGLLDSTLVIWGSEFGRTPLIQTLGIAGESWGRDHHPNAFTMWMAGGGIKPGQVVGKTDELGFNVSGRQGPRSRPARNDPSLPGSGTQAAHLSPHGQRLPPDGRGGTGGLQASGLTG